MAPRFFYYWGPPPLIVWLACYFAQASGLSQFLNPRAFVITKKAVPLQYTSSQQSHRTPTNKSLYLSRDLLLKTRHLFSHMLLAYFTPYLHSVSTASHTSRLSPFLSLKNSETPSLQTASLPLHFPSLIKNLRFGWLPVPPPRLLKCAKPLCILHRLFPQLTSCSPLPPSLNSQAARAFHFATISLSLHSSWCL